METKKTFKHFTIYDYEKEQDYLRQMHKSGWKFVKVSGFCVYHFEKCVPEDVVYQIDYNQDGIANKEEYVKMFNDCGWEYLQDYVGYSYFRKPASQTDGAEEIFCDDSSREQMVQRIFKGRVIPLLLLFFSVLVPGFIRNLYCERYVIAIMFGIVTVLYVVDFGIFSYKYYKFKRGKR